jgi:NitT/TauT family transport system substrate-binding protein
MSNKTLESLQKIDEEIDVFLELDSINSIVFEDFIKNHSLKNKTFNYINKDQSYISSLK